MKLSLLSLLMCFTLYTSAQDTNCRRGFDRLVMLANSPKVSNSEFTEALVVVDSLLRKQCYIYEIDRLGTVYAGASLSFLFGKICGLRNDTGAVRAYVVYITKKADPNDDELGMMFYKLFAQKPALVLWEIDRLENSTELMDILALGFIENSRDQYFKRLKKGDFKAFFYEKNPSLNSMNENARKQVATLLEKIDEVLID